MMPHRLLTGLIVLGMSLVVSDRATAGQVREVEAGADYRALLGELEPGDELVFLPGVHEGHAFIELAGTADEPITIRGVIDDQGERPELRFTGRGHNLWRLRGEHVHIRDLAFHATHAYAIRIDGGSHVRIENCRFRDNGGGDLSANTGDVASLHVSGCRFTGTRRTPVYIGHHDGSLDIRDFRFERNVIEGSRIEAGIGYGIQLKLNVDGVVRGNVILNSRGPGIMVYGFDDAETDRRQIVEGNIVIGARNNPNLVVGGGPATLSGNVALGGHAGGIAVINYGGRDLLHGLILRQNVAAGNRGRANLSVHGSARDPVAEGNRAFYAPETTGIGGLGESDRVGDNHAEPAEEALLQAIERLRDAVPTDETAADAVDALAEGPPSTQQDLAALLDRLLAGL